MTLQHSRAAVLTCVIWSTCVNQASGRGSSLRQFQVEPRSLEDVQSNFELTVHGDDGDLGSGRTTLYSERLQDVREYVSYLLSSNEVTLKNLEPEDTLTSESAIARFPPTPKKKKHWLHKDIFGAPEARDAGLSFFYSMPLIDWVLLLVALVALMLLDFFWLQNFVARRNLLPEDAEQQLKEFFEKSNNGREWTFKKDLVKACCENDDIATIFHLEARDKSDVSTVENKFSSLDSSQQISFEQLLQFYNDEIMSAEQIRKSFSTNMGVLGFWLLMGAAFNAVVFWRSGPEVGFEWTSGYLLEWLLSMDNLFVFHLIFRVYGTPKPLLHKALFLGIVGAIMFRMVFFLAVQSLLHIVHWVRFVFGILLIYSGIQAAGDEDDDADPSDLMAIRLLQWCLGDRLLSSYDVENKGVFVVKNGKLCATVLLPVIVCLELTDIIFAIDSVSAKVAQIPNYYIAYSSSVIAIFGLRAMFFIIKDMVDYFSLLKYGLCFILIFVGVELMISDYVKLPAHVVCIVILCVFLVCAAGSKIIENKQQKEATN